MRCLCGQHGKTGCPQIVMALAYVYGLSDYHQMFQRCRLKEKENGASGGGKCRERFFYKGLVGLKGSSDKASKRISLCQDLHCGEN